MRPWLNGGGFLPAHQVLGASERGAPTAFVVHGIMGSGRNWRSLVRRLAERRPGWRFVIVDLRHHGESGRAPPPDDLEACAEDLAELQTALDLPAHAIVGHSFGGKVALELAARRRGALRQVWVVDSPPGRADPGLRAGADRPGGTDAVLRAVREVPIPAPDRESVKQRLRTGGFSVALVEWMATNLKRTSSGFVWRFDPDAIDALLDSYWATDRTAIVRQPPAGLDVRMIRGADSDRWGTTDLALLESEALRGRVHVIEGAGHWLHTQRPDALLDVLSEGLPPAEERPDVR